MNSTGQGLGSNPLLGATESVKNFERGKSLGSDAGTAKSLNQKDFSGVLGRHWGDQQAAAVNKAQANTHQDSGILDTAEQPLPELPEGVQSGKPLPADAVDLPLQSVLPLADGSSSANGLGNLETVAAEDSLPLDGAVTGEAAAGVVAAPVELTDSTTQAEVNPLNSQASGGAGTEGMANPVAAALNPLDSGAAAPTEVASNAVKPALGRGAATASTGATAPVLIASTPVMTNVNIDAIGSQSGVVTPTVLSTQPTELAVNSSVTVTAATTTAAPDLMGQQGLKGQLGVKTTAELFDKALSQSTASSPLTEAGASTDSTSNLAASLLPTASPKSFQQANATSTVQTSVPVEVGKPGWSENVMQRVMWMSSQNVTKAEIALDPPELGPLQVRVSSQGDQTSVVFTSSHGAVRDALDQGLPRLREMLESQGIDLADVDVSDHQAQQQRHDAEEAGGESSKLAANGSEQAENGADMEGELTPAAVVAQSSLVDQYV